MILVDVCAAWTRTDWKPGKPTANGRHVVCRASIIYSAHGPNVKSRGRSARNVKSRHVAIPYPYGLKRLAPCAPREHLGSARIKAGKRSTGRWARTWPQGRHRACGRKLCGKDTTGLFPAGCLEPAFCPPVPFAPCRTLRRHGLRKGAFLRSIGTRVRPYRTLGERPVALHPRSYRTLVCVPCGGVAWCRRRRWEMPMCPPRGYALVGLGTRYVSLQMSAEPNKCWAIRPYVKINGYICTIIWSAVPKWYGL